MLGTQIEASFDHPRIRFERYLGLSFLLILLVSFLFIYINPLCLSRF